MFGWFSLRRSFTSRSCMHSSQDMNFRFIFLMATCSAFGASTREGLGRRLWAKNDDWLHAGRLFTPRVFLSEYNVCISLSSVVWSRQQVQTAR